MTIKIGEKIKPFSHKPGTRCVVPLSRWIIAAFPALLRVEGAGEWAVGITGPVKDFSVQLDLEHNCVWIWGIANEGYYRLKLSADESGLALTIDRAPAAGIQIGGRDMLRKEKILLVSDGFSMQPGQERLSLGNFKAQDWDLVRRRMDLKEIAPILFTLGQRVPPAGEAKGEIADLIESDLSAFVQAGLSDLVVPRLIDEEYQGIVFEQKGEGNPLGLLAMAYQKIRSFLVDGTAILPNLPHDWHAGRALSLQTAFGELDLEWTKRTIRRMVLRARGNGGLVFTFQKSIDSYRVNGKRIEKGATVSVEAGKTYLFDRFQK